ncbi:hypothetical protein [uncultured Psychroserpens sp.]|uniref:hypothetical protein n=1 Tax=uncultured Psychroserpens sp. TaxID=255436 RepID=UPI002602F9C9|nr:hypothetical protein [uncultured Psychroserpens sp.]
MDRLQFVTKAALTFFSIGTLLLILQLCFKTESGIAIIDLYYLLFAIVINSLILLVLIGYLIIKDNKLKTLKSIGILITNIPIADGYFYVVIYYNLF